MQFLIYFKEDIYTRYGCPKELASDHGTCFVNDVIKEWTKNKIKIKHWRTSRYHPRANGQTKNTNRMLSKIMTKMAQNSMTDTK